MHLHICDDHPLIIKSIATLFDGHKLFSQISKSSSKRELFLQLQKQTPDILILDININGVNMLDEIQNIKQHAPEIKIIILTSYDSQIMLRKALKTGIHAYLNKNTDENELLNAIRSISSNEIYITSGKTRQFVANDNFQMIQELSEREKQVIQLLLEGNPNKSMAEKLKISVTTVQTHRRNIYKKLNLQGIGELMSFAVEHKLY
jgi:DNA-binding NarL/FixJ family response regulator